MKGQTDGFRTETVEAINAVTNGLRIAAERIDNREVSAKAGRDVVTTADIEVETAICTQLGDALGIPSIGEEHGGEVPADGSPYWLIDPICGTRNYASGIPLYAVNLALVEGSEITIAAVGDASRNHVVVAEKGHGAWALRDGQRQRLEVDDSTKTIALADGAPTAQVRERAADLAQRIIQEDRWDFRSYGTTLSLVFLASGRISGYVVFGAPAIHTAPGVLLALEAGATVTDIDGHPWQLDSTSVVAAPPLTHKDLRALIADTSRPA